MPKVARDHPRAKELSWSSAVTCVAAPDGAFGGAALLISMPAGTQFATVREALLKTGASIRSAALVGSHATRYRVSAGR